MRNSKKHLDIANEYLEKAEKELNEDFYSCGLINTYSLLALSHVLLATSTILFYEHKKGEIKK